MIKHGAKKENLVAKIFGGGHVLDIGRGHASIPSTTSGWRG